MTTRLAAVLVLGLSLAACERTTPAAPAAAGDTASQATAPEPAPAPPLQANPAVLVLPGAFSAATTVDALRARFGAANVHVGDVPGAEGETSQGVILFPDEPARRAYLYFADPAHLQGLARVRIADAPSTWRLDNGIAIGTTLAELARRNGQPITYAGLGWDYGGTVQDLHGGALAASPEGPTLLGWRLGPKDEDAAAADAYPIGDGSFRSDDTRYPRQGETLVVSEVWAYFPAAETR